MLKMKNSSQYKKWLALNKCQPLKLYRTINMFILDEICDRDA